MTKERLMIFVVNSCQGRVAGDIPAKLLNLSTGFSIGGITSYLSSNVNTIPSCVDTIALSQTVSRSLAT